VTRSPRALRLGFLFLVGLLFTWVAWEANSFPDRARIFPQTIALLGLAVAVVKFVLLAHRDDVDPDLENTADREPEMITTVGEEWRRARPFLLSFAAYAAGIGLLGFLPASGIFVLLFLRRFDRMGWRTALPSAALFILLLFGLTRLIGLELPEGLLGVGT